MDSEIYQRLGDLETRCDELEQAQLSASTCSAADGPQLSNESSRSADISYEYLIGYREVHERLCGSLFDCIDKIGGHFREGKIKGNGEWRLLEIHNAIVEAEQAISDASDEMEGIRNKENTANP